MSDPQVQEKLPQLLQGIRVQTATDGTYTWNFATAFPTGTLPVLGVDIEDNTANITWNSVITALSNIAASIKITKTTSAVQVLGINVLSIAASPQAIVHITAFAA